MNMKRSVLALALFGLSGAASAGVISDNYIGATVWDPVDAGKDVVGTEWVYDISGFDAELSGTQLTVNIYTDFAGRTGGKPDEFWDPRDHSKRGIGYGDLFLARDWTPFGSASYPDDTYANGTVWEYGFALDDSFSNSGGSGTLYRLDAGDNDANAYLTNDANIGDYNYRADQELLVDTSSPVTAVGTGSWDVSADPDIGTEDDTGDGILTFVIDLTGTTLLDELTTGDGAIALHWTMFCGNDVIEGEWSVPTVPAPGSILLLGLGLAALSAGQLRRKRSVNC